MCGSMRGIRIQMQMNRARHAAAGRKRQRSQFEIRLTKALRAQRGANRADGGEQGQQFEAGGQEVRRIAKLQRAPQGTEGHRQKKHVQQHRGHPPASRAGAILAGGAARGPIFAPEPRRAGVGLLACRLFFLQGVAVARPENETAADDGEDRGERRRADACSKGLIGCLEKTVRGEKAEAQKGQAEEAQDDGAEFGRSGHRLFYHSRFGAWVKPRNCVAKVNLGKRRARTRRERDAIRATLRCGAARRIFVAAEAATYKATAKGKAKGNAAEAGRYTCGAGGICDVRGDWSV